MSSCSAENELTSSNGGNEILFNVEEVPFKPDSTSGGAATRATKLTSVSSFKLYAYDSNNTAIANGVTYTKSGNSWTTTSKVFWPQTGNVTFYAFSPTSNSSVSFNTTSKTLTYTAPTGESSQQDVLYAYKTSARPTNNTVDLTFNHANAAFSVNARLASGCTATVNVSGVQLVNVKPTNTLTFSNGSTSASGSNISSTLACSAKTLTTSNQAISSSPLIIPPQSVTAWAGNNAISSQTGTYLAVTCNVLSNGTYVVGSSSANGTVYVPMDKTLNKGEDNSVNLVFGTLDDDKRYYGRDENGNRISAAEKLIINGHEAVDLGLSVKWATMNVGASSPEGTGNYYAWAETDQNNGNATKNRTLPTATGWNYAETTSPYYSYKRDSVRTNNGQVTFRTTIYYWSKYFNDGKTTLELIDDAANVAWGGNWRTPTLSEAQELRNKCTWTWTTLNGIQGYMVTRTGYSGSIFLPCNGRRDGTSSAYYNYDGEYLCSNYNGTQLSATPGFTFRSGVFAASATVPRRIGMGVRAVYK